MSDSDSVGGCEGGCESTHGTHGGVPKKVRVTNHKTGEEWTGYYCLNARKHDRRIDGVEVEVIE